MNLFAPFRGVQRYFGKIRTIHNEIRTERFMNTLPEEIRRDIGWPDRDGRPYRQLPPLR